MLFNYKYLRFCSSSRLLSLGQSHLVFLLLLNDSLPHTNCFCFLSFNFSYKSKNGTLQLIIELLFVTPKTNAYDSYENILWTLKNRYLSIEKLIESAIPVFLIDIVCSTSIPENISARSTIEHTKGITSVYVMWRGWWQS